MDIDVKKKFDAYPKQAKTRLLMIRGSILELSNKDDIGEITETLKWGEPSYITPKGSTVRIGWNPKNIERVSVYFNCKTTLIETFREIYCDTFQFVGNREVTLPVSGEIPLMELMACISMSLRYHNIKHLPLLGA